MRGYLENFAAYYSALYDFTRSLTIFVVRIFNLTLNPSPVRRGTMYCPLLLAGEGMGMRLATKIVRVPFYLISVCNGKLFQSVH
jgi:hypothetical protein